MTKRSKTPVSYKNPARFRLDFIKENTFNRVWSVRMTRTRVLIVSASIVAAGIALLWVALAYTPLRQLLPGALKGDLRAEYLTTAVKLDSLELAAGRNAAYLANIAALLQGEVAQDDTARVQEIAVDDSLLAASEAERRFVRSYESQERFNLSVLAPIAAEGMVFAAPVGATAKTESLDTKGLMIKGPRNTSVSAVYRGTIVMMTTGSDGLTSIAVQHPNDFVSVYTGLGEVFVDRGQRVEAGQRLGQIGDHALVELWHKGTSLDPLDYIPL